MAAKSISNLEFLANTSFVSDKEASELFMMLAKMAHEDGAKLSFSQKNYKLTYKNEIAVEVESFDENEESKEAT